MPIAIYEGRKIVGIAKNNKEADKIISRLANKEIRQENKIWRRKKKRTSHRISSWGLPYGLRSPV